MKPFLLLLTVVLAASVVPAAERPAAPKETTKARRDAMLAQVADVPGLPRVLILGDSISMAYTPLVRRALAGKANIHRPPENCLDTHTGLRKLESWLGSGKWDVIHFNFGLHDNNHLDATGKLVDVAQGRLVSTPEVYGRNLREIVARLKRTGARLIFATTTPIPPGAVGRVPDAERAYNRVALEVMREAGVEINDLHAFLASHPQPRPAPNNVHFLDAGNEALARVVTERLTAALPAR